jgi:hypothetical protein
VEDDRETPGHEDLAEATQRQNSNLQLLIASIGSLLAASRDLLRRLHGLVDGGVGRDPGSGPKDDAP